SMADRMRVTSLMRLRITSGARARKDVAQPRPPCPPGGCWMPVRSRGATGAVGAASAGLAGPGDLVGPSGARPPDAQGLVEVEVPPQPALFPGDALGGFLPDPGGEHPRSYREGEVAPVQQPLAGQPVVEQPAEVADAPGGPQHRGVAPELLVALQE